eukprot:m.124583 g.124583  ORF g.124583 m.124583 type:complete len:467 (+) comp15711_c0_seq4:1322-2722(+)
MFCLLAWNHHTGGRLLRLWHTHHNSSLQQSPLTVPSSFGKVASLSCVLLGLVLVLVVVGTQSVLETEDTSTLRWTWACDAVLSYKSIKLSSAAYSPDGSLLAVGTETGAVALFSVEQAQLVRVLLHPGSQAVHRLVFSSTTPHLAVGSSSHLAIFDLLTCQLLHTSTFAVHHLAAHPTEAEFVVAGKAEHQRRPVVMLWDPTQAAPSVKLPGNTMLGLTYVVSDGVAKPVGLDDTLQMVVVSEDSEEYSHLRSVAKNAQLAAQDDEQGPSVLYRRIFGTLAVAAGPTDAVTMASGVPPWDTMFTAPSHTLPPINRLLDDFLAQTLHLSLGSTQRTLQDTLAGDDDDNEGQSDAGMDQAEDSNEPPHDAMDSETDDEQVDVDAEMAARLAARFDDVVHCNFDSLLVPHTNGAVATPKAKSANGSRTLKTPKNKAATTPQETPKRAKSTGKKKAGSSKKTKTPKASKT